MKTPVLETARLILRPLAVTDAPAVQRHFNNWNIIKNLSTVVPWPYPAGGAEAFIKSQLPKMAQGVSYIWALTLKSGDECIGIVDFHPGDGRGQGERGFWLAEHLWGQGLMTEAVEAVNRFVFKTLGIREYFVCNVAGNSGSRRVKQKTGAEFIGYVEIPHHNGETRSERWRVRAPD